MMKRTCQEHASAILAALLSCCFCHLTGLGAVVNVAVGNNIFSPTTTNIKAGDQVIWTWKSGSQNHHVVGEFACRDRDGGINSAC